MKTLVVYCYYETEQTKCNLNFFLKNGTFSSAESTFIFIINNKTCSLEFPKYDNVKVMLRDDNSNDLVTYKWLVQTMGDEYFLEYSYFYFINSSCIGPFIPSYAENNWIKLFNQILEKNAMVGPVIEVPPDNLGFKALGIDNPKNIPFIHSYMFGVTRSGFSVVKNVFAQITTDDKTYAVHNTERKLTSAVLVNGHKVSSLLSRFKNVDLNDQTNWDYKLWKGPKNATCYEVPGNYFGIDLNPYEIIFVKNIRNANETRSQFSSGISDKLFLEIQNYSKWL
jgi:sRNA-binding regulator protein Hfq